VIVETRQRLAGLHLIARPNQHLAHLAIGLERQIDRLGGFDRPAAFDVHR
jgi:hypothetical protein